MKQRVLAWARRNPMHVRGISVTELLLRVVQRFLAVRVMGLSAEMTYFALLSLFPLIGAIGASLGFVERLWGADSAAAAEAAVLAALSAVFSPEVTGDVVAPLVEGLLREERAGFALGSFLFSLFFASRIFRSAIDTLDTAYRVDERRGTVQLWSLGLVFAIGAVVLATTLLVMVVVGPLLGGGRALALRLGLGEAFEILWALARWPVIFAIATSFLAMLYRFGPNARNTWRGSLPGAVFGMTMLVLLSFGFRIYIEATGIQSPVITDADDAVLLALQMFGALMAALFWLWLSGMAILAGGVVNAEIAELRGRPAPQKK
jgi:membrane protein